MLKFYKFGTYSLNTLCFVINDSCNYCIIAILGC